MIENAMGLGGLQSNQDNTALDSDDDSSEDVSSERSNEEIIQDIRQRFFQEILPDVKKELMKTVDNIIDKMESAMSLRLSSLEDQFKKQTQTLCRLEEKLNEYEPMITTNDDNEKQNISYELLKKIKKKIEFEEERYYASTLQIRGFQNIKARNRFDRNAAASVLKIMDCTSWVDEAQLVLFSKDFSNLRLTFSSPAMCENAVKSLSISASLIKRREDSVVPLVFSALIHPKYHEQKKILFNHGAQLKREGHIFKFNFMTRRGQLGIRCHTRGQQNKILLYSEVLSMDSGENDMNIND